jgi:hypothetical protein
MNAEIIILNNPTSFRSVTYINSPSSSLSLSTRRTTAATTWQATGLFQLRANALSLSHLTSEHPISL